MVNEIKDGITHLHCNSNLQDKLTVLVAMHWQKTQTFSQSNFNTYRVLIANSRGLHRDINYTHPHRLYIHPHPVSLPSPPILQNFHSIHRVQMLSINSTRGSAIAEELRDALRQLKYYGRFLTKLLTRSSANPQEPCEHTVS